MCSSLATTTYKQHLAVLCFACTFVSSTIMLACAFETAAELLLVGSSSTSQSICSSCTLAAHFCLCAVVLMACLCATVLLLLHSCRLETLGVVQKLQVYMTLPSCVPGTRVSKHSVTSLT
jgi:hypothetical protein